jgi:hypothetical protein
MLTWAPGLSLLFATAAVVLVEYKLCPLRLPIQEDVVRDGDDMLSIRDFVSQKVPFSASLTYLWDPKKATS